MGRAIAEGEIQPVPPQAAARIWLALAQGYSAQLLYAPRPEKEVRGEVETALRGILPQLAL